MAPKHLSYLNNPISDRYWAHGGEEIIGPLGPYAAALAQAVARLDPEPAPWRVAVGQLVQAVQAKDLAAKLPKGLQEQTLKSANAAIANILDDWCGTPPRKWPWPWPGPPSWIWDMATEITTVANSLAAGSLRDGLTEVAAQVVEKASQAR